MKGIAECTCNFAIDYLKSQFKENSEKNTILSPISVNMALISIAIGSGGTTASQIKALLHFLSTEPETSTDVPLLGSPCYKSGEPYYHWKQTASAITQHFQSYQMKLAQRFYVSHTFEVLRSYKHCIKEINNSELESVDFMNETEKIRKEMNSWCEKKTNGAMKNSFPDNSILSSFLLVSASTFHFRGKWKLPFNPRNTHIAPFWTCKDRSINVQMMTQLGNSNIATIMNPSMKVLELPHENEEICSYFCVPEGPATIAEMLTMSSFANLVHWISSESMKIMEVKIYMPKFKLRDNYSMKSYLMQMGVTDMFSSNEANLSGMSERPGLCVTDMRSTIYFDMDEEGAAVAGASRAEIVDGSHFEVKCNKPFLIIVIHKPTGSLLFIGIVCKPQ